MYYTIGSSNELYHYGVKGMKWGVRRYSRDQRARQLPFVTKITKQYETNLDRYERKQDRLRAKGKSNPKLDQMVKKNRQTYRDLKTLGKLTTASLTQSDIKRGQRQTTAINLLFGMPGAIATSRMGMKYLRDCGINV